MKRISAEAYQALREALAVTFRLKRLFENYLRVELRDHPELLAGPNFSDTKRIVADHLVDRLVQAESTYQDATIQLMLALATVSSFPDIEHLEEPDRTEKLGTAQAAVCNSQSFEQDSI